MKKYWFKPVRKYDTGTFFFILCATQRRNISALKGPVSVLYFYVWNAVLSENHYSAGRPGAQIW